MSRGIIGLGLWIVTAVLPMTSWAEPQINLGNLPAGKKVTITYDVTVNNDTSGNQISSQSTVTGANFAAVVSDDPDTAAVNDATVTNIDSADTSLALLASDNTPTSSELVTFTASVSATDANINTPTGNVEFLINGLSQATVALDGSGQAGFNTAFSVGNYSVSANYLGNAEFTATTDSVNITASPAGTTTTITSVSANSIYPGDVVTFNVGVTIDPVAGGLPITGTINVSDGSNSCSADVAVGSCSIQFNNPGSASVTATYISSSSEVSGSTSAAVNIDVINGPPVINPISDQVIQAQQPLVFTVSAIDPDPGAVVTYSLGNNAPAGAQIDSTTGDFSWTPNSQQAGNDYPLNVIAEDEFGATAMESFTVTVVENDGSPIAYNDQIQLDEDKVIVFNPLANDSADKGFDISTLKIVTQPGSGSISVDYTDGEMSYRPEKDFVGQDEVKYQFEDVENTLSNIATISIDVLPVNDKPEFISEPVYQVVEVTEYRYNVEAIDADGDTITLSLQSAPLWLQLVGNQLVGTPQPTDTGIHDVVLRASDNVSFREQSFQIRVVSSGSSDVSVTQESSMIAPLLNEPFNLAYHLENDGPVDAAGVELSIALTGQIQLIDYDSRCVANQLSLICTLGVLSVGATDTISISLLGEQVGDSYSFAEVTVISDEIPDNNQSALGVSVTTEIMSDKSFTVGEAASSLVLTGDLNNDQLEDIVLLKGISSIGSVYLNQGSSTFEKQADINGYEQPVDAKLMDINADNVLDLVIATADNEATLVYRGAGDGSFRLVQVLDVADSSALDVADIDGDGLNDVVVANRGPNDVYLNSGGQLQLSHKMGNKSSLAILLEDIDRDGLIDSVVSNENSITEFYRNDQLLDVAAPANNFTAINAGFVRSISQTDLDQDGWAELIFGQGINPNNKSLLPQNQVYQWNSGFTLMQEIGAMDTAEIIHSDVDGDGDMDAFIGNFIGAHQIYFNTNGVYELSDKLLVNTFAEGINWLRNDVTGLIDIIVAENLEEGSAIYSNKGNGEFGASFADLNLAYQISTASITQQGVADILFTVTNNGPGVAIETALEISTNELVNIIAYGSGISGCTVTQSSMSCSLDNLEPGESRQVPLRVIGITVGQGMVTADVSSMLSIDPVASNNQQQVAVTVRSKKDGSGGGHTGLWFLLLLLLMGYMRRATYR